MLGQHGLHGDALEILEAAAAPVLRGERVLAVHDAHHVERAPALVGGHPGVVLAAVYQVLDHHLEVVRPRDLDLALAAPHDALEQLAAEHRTRAASPELMPVVVVDAGEAHQTLAGRADDASLSAAVASARQQFVFGPVGVHAPHAGSVVDHGALVADVQVHGRVRAALHDDDLVAGACELRRHVAAGVALAEAAGERRGEVHRVAVAAQHGRAGHGSDHEDELVLRAQRVDLRSHLAAQIVRADALGADELREQVRRYGLLGRGARGEVDAKKVAHACSFAVPPVTLPASRARRPRPRRPPRRPAPQTAGAAPGRASGRGSIVACARRPQRTPRSPVVRCYASTVSSGV